MADQVSIAARPRAGSGKGEARSLRRDGRVPAIAYGADLAATAISVDERELWHALHTDAGANAILRLDVEGDTHLALAREIQRHPLRRDIVHVDFVTVSRNVKVHVDVPVHLRGADDSPGVDEGGVLSQELYALAVEVLPLEVPDELVLDVSDMAVGDTRRVSDIVLPEGVTAIADPDATVATLVVPQLDVPEPSEEVLEGISGDEAEGATADEAEASAGDGGAAGGDEGEQG